MRKPFSPTKADLEYSARVDAAMARQAAERAAASTKAAADARVQARIDAEQDQANP
jgi:hypothetical protein